MFDEKAEEVLHNDAAGTKTWYGWRLALLLLDLKSGAIIGKRSWVGDISWRKQLFPTSDGNFVVLTTRFPEPVELPMSPKAYAEFHGPHPTSLLLVSAQGKELGHVELPIRGSYKDEHWEILASPSGKSVLLTHVDEGAYEFRLLDANTLRERYRWSRQVAPRSQVLAVSDNQVLIFDRKEGSMIGEFGGTWRSLPLPTGHSQFLADNMVLTLVISPLGTGEIMRTSGQELATFRLEIHDTRPKIMHAGVYPPFVSADGSRFGTVISQVGGSRLFPKLQHTLWVWQSAGPKPIFQAEIPYSIPHSPEAALSADGIDLALVNAGKVLMFSLPSSSSP